MISYFQKRSGAAIGRGLIFFLIRVHNALWEDYNTREVLRENSPAID